MTKEEFIIKLKKKLDILEKSEIEDIVSEYEGYIEEKMASGMSEKEAVKALGNIDEIAKDLLSAYKIKDNYHENNSINVINKFTDAIIDGIDSFINVFRGKSSKEVARIIVEIFLLFVLISLCRIPFEILSEIGYDTFMVFGYKIGDVLYSIWRLILDLIYFGFAIIFFFKLLKERIIERNIDDKVINNKKIEKEIYKEDKVKEKKVKVKTEKEKDKNFDIIGVFTNIFLFFVKFIVGILAIGNAFYIAGITCVLVVAIYLLIQGVTYYGILFFAVALLLFGISTFELLIKFIFDKKNNYTKFIIVVLSSLVVGGAGMGIFATEMAQTTYIDQMKNGKTKIHTDVIAMEDKLIIPDYYHIEIDNSLTDKIKIDYEYYPNYLEFKISPYKVEYDYGYTFYEPDFMTVWSKKTFNELIKDAKNKTFYNYSDLMDITIYISKENLNKVRENAIEYDKLINTEECYFNGYGDEICF